MKYENKTIKEYCDDDNLKYGDTLYCFLLGIVTEFEFMYVAKSESDESLWAVLEPKRMISYSNPKKWFDAKHFQIMRANYKYDVRFSMSFEHCLRANIQSLKSHIESSESQLKQAQKLLDNIS